ncbi:hypothetical protein [Streptomyces spectabilis]|uniref:CO/xanthine dehydrogenase FAD-binding subunit n=1 Tax=Streptomyces spectabilis TaxID=68270 RepID=A0A5P2XGH5_STRST|nr:hypothetical protein [Streptomyces spectabilis]MBB5102254.1 CO/xanthine dehydrogenase FAD-binding subunit [Streptomyces spectabilis]MCI3907302.1 hypothetical protein [Streptomyces spectabilis]QEV64033.1 hypothetical protein CP982_39495 [Streptomyces spectabilis]GGV29746.1 hypothetical protein GCM10010245_48290 [Streptomyces spectabilis]
MKIAKAAFGVVGVAMALGAATPAVAAEPLGGGQQLLDTAVTGNKTPLDAVDVKKVVGTVDETAGKLKKADAATGAAKVSEVANGAGAL